MSNRKFLNFRVILTKRLSDLRRFLFDDILSQSKIGLVNLLLAALL